MDAERALRILRERLLELEDLDSVQGRPFDAWKAKTLADLRRLFPDADYAERLEKTWHPRHIGGPGGARPEVLQADFENQKDDSAGLLEAALHEVREYWEPESGPHAVSVTKDAHLSRRVFVVHGHDEAMRTEVVRALEQLDLVPVVLSEKPDLGRTIIEKFEHEADVGYAVILYSPDDKFSDQEGQSVERPRQNVVLEQGYFIGVLGRNRVTTLARNPGRLEAPSDVLGVLYIPFDDGAWKLKLVRELRAAGYEVDANRLS